MREAERAGARDEFAEPADADIIEQPRPSLMRRVEHRAVKPGVRQERQHFEVGTEIGEEHGDETDSRAERRELVDDLAHVGRHRQREFYEVHAGCRRRLDRRAGLRNVVRQLDNGADRAPLRDERDDAGDLVERQRAQRAAPCVLAVYDVRSASDGGFGLRAREHAGEHQGHAGSPKACAKSGRPPVSTTNSKGALTRFESR